MIYNILFSKDKFYLTIIIGFFTFQINQIIEYHSNVPYLTYEFCTINEKNSTILECTIQNINNRKAMKNIDISITYQSKYKSLAKLSNPEIIPIAPSATLGETDSYKNILLYRIPQINPSSKYILKMNFDKKSSKKIMPKIYLETSDNIRLISSKNLFIRIIRYQVAINIISIVALFLFIFIKKNKKNKTNETNETNEV